MKKTLFALLCFLFITLSAQAQEDGANLAKQAGEALTSYNIDPTANAPKLDEAKQKIDQALPHFQKAKSLDPNDVNTLIALREIYARKVDDGVSLEFKNRLDTVRDGRKNTTTYFKK